MLFQTAQSPSSVKFAVDAGTTSLGPSNRRRRVRFVGLLDTDGIREVLAAALIAVVVDERPAGQRRAASPAACAISSTELVLCK